MRLLTDGRDTSIVDGLTVCKHLGQETTLPLLGRGKSTNVCWSIVFCPTVFNEVTMLVNRPLHVTFLQNNNVGHFTLAA